jgi:hypothetical protein
MEHLIQVEIRTDTTHTLTWLDAALKPKPGMVLLHKDDQRPWTVVHAYITPQEMRVNHSDWKLGSDVTSPASKEK